MRSSDPRSFSRWAPNPTPPPPPPPPPAPQPAPPVLDLLEVNLKLDAVVRRGLGPVFQFDRLLEQEPGAMTYLAQETDRKQAVILRVYDRAELEASDRLESLQQAVSELATLRHPAIVPICRFGLGGHTYWWSSQYVRAPTLAELVRSTGPLPLERVVTIIAPVASALAHAHERDFTHGNVSPDNVVVAAADSGLLKDFVVEERPGVAQRSPSEDQRALAITIYRGLTGDLDSPAANVAADLASADAVEARCPDLESEMALALVRAAEAKPSRQFGSVMELISALRPPPPPGQTPNSAPEIFVPNEELDRYRLRRRRRWIITAVVSVLVVWAGLIVRTLDRGKRSSTSPIATVTVAGASSSLVALRQPAATDSTARAVPDSTAQAAPDSNRLVVRAPGDSAGTVSAAAAPTIDRADSVPPLSPAQPAVDTAAAKVVQREPVPVAVRPETPRTRPKSQVPARARLGTLFVKSRPSGTLYIDNRRIGSTPKSNLRVPAGSHVIRVERPGHRRYLVMINVAPGQVMRLADIALEPRR